MSRVSRQPPPTIDLSEQRLLGAMPERGALDGDGVHRVRRAAKRSRALLRLAEDAGRRRARRIRVELTRTMRPLAPLRDATIVREQAQKLAQKLKGTEQAAALALVTQPPVVRNARWWAAEWQRLAALRRSFSTLESQALTEKELRRGLRRSVRRVCKRQRRVHRDRQFNRAHDWRKSVILLRDQVEALTPPPNSELARLAQQLKRIGHLLGVAADQRVVIEAFEARRWPDELKKPAKHLIARARKKQKRRVAAARKCWRKVKPLLKAVRKFG